MTIADAIALGRESEVSTFCRSGCGTMACQFVEKYGYQAADCYSEGLYS